MEKTHYRKAFNSPYLSSADIIEPTILHISHVKLEPDKTKKTKDCFNTAYFNGKELRPGELLKPMILNATNSRTMKHLTGSPFIDDWCNIHVTVYVDSSIKFRGDVVDGLRISSEKPSLIKPLLTKSNINVWANAVSAYKRDGNFGKIEERYTLSDVSKIMIQREAQNVA